MKLLSNIFDLLKETYERISEFQLSLHGAAIAFYAIFSTAPLAIILIWVASILLGDQLGQAEFQETLHEILGAELTSSISDVVESASEGSSGFWSTLIAIFTLLFGATTLLSQVKHTLNEIWGLKNPKIGTIRYFLWDRLVGLFFIMALSILFFAGLISESLIYGLEFFLVPVFGVENIFLIQVGNSLVNIVLAFTFFTAMFKILPDIEVRLRDIAVGSIVTTVLVLIGKSLVDWYLGTVALQPAYKAAGSFVIFLIWIYYNVLVVLVGAIFTEVFTRRYGGKVDPYWDASLHDDWY